jgi:hypothetical protein
MSDIYKTTLKRGRKAGTPRATKTGARVPPFIEGDVHICLAGGPCTAEKVYAVLFEAIPELDEAAPPTLGRVKEVLRDMMKRRVVLASVSPNGTTVYRLRGIP